MSDLEKIKQIAEQMPDGPEKQQGLQAYYNLKMFETIAELFERKIMKIKMTPQATKTLFEDFSHDDLQAIKEACCEACKGDIWFWDSDCRFSCEGFVDEALEYIRCE